MYHHIAAGLDARAAAIVMRTVRNIVNTGRTIVCTVHQPSIDIFESFDELLLLKRGGQTIYAGEQVCLLQSYDEQTDRGGTEYPVRRQQGSYGKELVLSKAHEYLAPKYNSALRNNA